MTGVLNLLEEKVWNVLELTCPRMNFLNRLTIEKALKPKAH